MTEDSEKSKKKLIYTYSGVILGCTLVGVACWFVFFRNMAYTDDAYVQGNQVMLTPLVPGFVTGIYTDDAFLVSKGQVLVELDTTNAKIALDRAKENLASKVREVCQHFHDVFAIRAEIGAKKAEFIKSAQDYEHRLYVLAAGGVSVEDFEHAVAALRSSFFLLQMTEIHLEKALALVKNTSILSHPEVLNAKDIARQAFVDLHRCKITSPVEGIVAQRRIQVGMWIPQGEPLLAIIPLDQIWINANFKETQMKRMRIDQSVTLRSDLYGSEVSYHGKIVGLPGGAGNAFSILPPQNLSGNWIKIVQRLPVRIQLDRETLTKYPLRIGLSMEARVDLTEPGVLVPSSSEGAPNYITNIFVEEELGDLPWIEEIIFKNADSSLNAFLVNPLTWES
ncbi:MAG: HlyD family secretion protein [Chlamydiota bacterium]